MEWLTLLAAHPAALASLQRWLESQERLCSEHALDVPSAEVPTLKGQRDAYRTIRAYINNNLPVAQRTLAANGAS